MNLSETFEAVKKLPEDVINSVMPHIGNVSFFRNILREDINFDGMTKKKALKTAFAYCKKEMKNSGMSAGEKAKFIAGLPKLLYDSENHARVLKKSVGLIENPENTFPLNNEWAAVFFAYAKKVSDRDIQAILGKILADELERKDGANSAIVELSEAYFVRVVENMRIS